MDNLLLILFFLFVGVALMVVLGERFASPADPEKMARLQRWFMPLVGLMLVLSALEYFLR
ncbi:MAG: hypothetical protein R3228_18015 [Halioglobus sp.]|nr:hypothetical protein [Halioglobus sp.]